jgi:hypothetical protein
MPVLWSQPVFALRYHGMCVCKSIDCPVKFNAFNDAGFEFLQRTASFDKIANKIADHKMCVVSR